MEKRKLLIQKRENVAGWIVFFLGLLIGTFGLKIFIDADLRGYGGDWAINYLIGIGIYLFGLLCLAIGLLMVGTEKKWCRNATIFLVIGQLIFGFLGFDRQVLIVRRYLSLAPIIVVLFNFVLLVILVIDREAFSIIDE